MNIQETDYNWIRKPKNAERIRMSNLGWTVPMQFPFPIWLNGNMCKSFYINNFGAIRFPEILGDRYHFIHEDKKLFKDISDTDKGMMLVPWGEMQRVISCGVGVWKYTIGDKFVIDYITKSPYDKRTSFMYQVVFSATDKDRIVLNYYHCVSGYSTFIGMVLEPDNYVDWPLKETQPYMKKSLEVLVKDSTSVTHTFPPTNTTFPPSTNTPPINHMPGTTHMPGTNHTPSNSSIVGTFSDDGNSYNIVKV